MYIRGMATSIRLAIHADPAKYSKLMQDPPISQRRDTGGLRILIVDGGQCAAMNTDPSTYVNTIGMILGRPWFSTASEAHVRLTAAHEKLTSRQESPTKHGERSRPWHLLPCRQVRESYQWRCRGVMAYRPQGVVPSILTPAAADQAGSNFPGIRRRLLPCRQPTTLRSASTRGV